MAPSTLPPRTARQQSDRIAFRRALSLLGLTLVLPGSAQVIAGGKGLGRFALKVWLVVVGAALAFGALVLLRRDWALALYAHPVTQWIGSWVVLALGLGWALLLLDAWRLARPRRLSGSRQVWLGLTSALLAAVVGFSSVQASALSRSQAALFGAVFAGGGSARAEHGRLNVLVVGADAEPDRPGVRTDTMMVASVDADTGRTVLFSLPRNLQGAPFPRTSPLRELYPRGYRCDDESCLLNAVHTLGTDHADLYPDARDPGMQALREVVGETLGLRINYHAVVDMRGFEDLVDALGGVRLDIAKPVPIGGGSSRVEGWIQPGRGVRLDGFQALWFARSRHGADDYERMARQKCLIGALAKQADPVTLVSRFNELAEAGGRTVATDVPPSQLGRLVELADAGRRLPIGSVSFAPPLIEPAHPDLGLIRETVREQIAVSERLDEQAVPVDAPPATPGAEPSASAAPAPSVAPEADGPDAEVATTRPRATADFSTERRTDDLEEICSVG